MGETADQIASDIDRTREDLKANLEELETKVKEVTDWRGHFRKHPAPMVVAALVGGVLLSAILGKHSPSGRD
jgi:hypothetical protein